MKTNSSRRASLTATIKACSVFVPAALAICSVAPASADLVVNGGFEENVIAYDSYTIGPVTGWSLDPASVGYGIELQNHIAGSPYQGNQFCELNSNATTGIYQNLATVVGQSYDLSFAYSPRPDVNQINTLHVTWGGTLEATITGNGASNSDTVWTVYNYDLTATSTSTRLEFDDFGDPNSSLGTYIDAVSVVPVTNVGTTSTPEPGSAALLIGLSSTGMGLVARRRRTIRKTA